MSKAVGVPADLNCAPLHASEKRRGLNQLDGLDGVEMCAADKWLASVVMSDHCLFRGLCLPRLGIVWLGTSILFNPSILSPSVFSTK
jgi:hypothetical protein